MTKAYKYQFRPHVGFREAEDTLILAFLAAEGIFGEARVRMDGGYSHEPAAMTLTVDASTLVGQIINSIFLAYALKEFGKENFSVKRLAEGVAA